MDIAKLHALMGKLTDQQLAQELSRPSGVAPLYMVMGEMDRRVRLRKGTPKEPQSYADGGPVYDEDWFKYFQGVLGEGIGVNSGYRDPEHNRRVGGVANSYHTRTPGRGQALDIRLPRGLSPQEAIRRVRGGPRPLSEALYHDNHLHVAWGGPQRYAGAGAGGPQAPAGPAAAAAPAGPLDPEELRRRSNESVAGFMRMLGIDPSKPPTVSDAHAELSALAPDRTTEPYNELISEIQAQRAQYERSQRGRPLMEMGLAMMGAKGPNFFNALAQGGAAGLQARDRVQQGQQAMMMQLLQGRMAQAQAQAQRDQTMLGAAAGLTGQTRSAIGQAAGLGMGQAQAETNLAISNANRALQEQQIAMSGAQAAAAQAQAEAQGRRADAELGLRREAFEREARLNPEVRPGMGEQEWQNAVGIQTQAMFENYLKGLDDKTRAKLMKTPGALDELRRQIRGQAIEMLAPRAGRVITSRVNVATGAPVGAPARPGTTTRGQDYEIIASRPE